MHRQRFYTDPFTDLLFNALLGFVFLFMVAILFMNPIAKLGTARWRIPTGRSSRTCNGKPAGCILIGTIGGA
jgi:hypothetical protein